MSENSEKEQTDEVEIMKNALVAIVVIKSRKDDGSYYVHAKDITGEGSSAYSPFSTIDLSDDDEIMAVIPALPESYRVYGYAGGFEPLGYEFKGAYHNDWEYELKQKKEQYSRKMEQYRKTHPDFRG